MQQVTLRAAHAVRNALFSPGFKMFGPPFAAEYLRYAVFAARHWESRGAGEVKFMGFRISYLDHKVLLGGVNDVFMNGIYAFQPTREDPLVIDCGANMGMVTLFYKSRFPKSRVVSYEPHPATFGLLRRNVEQNGLQGVELHASAVSDANGTVTLYDSPVEEAALNVSIDAGWVGGEPFTVPAERLSDRIDEPVDFLKMNVEGSEYRVLDDLIATGAIRHVREAAVCWHAIEGVDDGERAVTERLRSAGMEVTPVHADAKRTTGMVRAVRR